MPREAPEIVRERMKRLRTDPRVKLRERAYHRALTKLAHRYPDEFRELYEGLQEQLTKETSDG